MKGMNMFQETNTKWVLVFEREKALAEYLSCLQTKKGKKLKENGEKIEKYLIQKT